MAHTTITLALFDSEAAADAAASSLGATKLAKGDAIGVLALDAEGKLKVDRVGARSTKTGAGIGAVLWLLGPVGAGAAIGGGVLGALHRKGLGLDDADQARISKELEGGHAAVGVLTSADETASVSAHLASLGGTPELYEAPDVALDHAVSQAPPEMFGPRLT